MSHWRETSYVCCGLEGFYIPGRRWRRKLEIIQPVEIHSFAADFNSEDLLCVQIKNVAPAHASDIVIFIDDINIIFEESTKMEQCHHCQLRVLKLEMIILYQI